MARRLVLGLLVVVALGAAVIGAMYIRDSRDVEVVTIANLPGAANTTGLTRTEQQQYYHLTEDGEIYPIAALLALEAPEPADPSKLVPFLHTAERYGMRQLRDRIWRTSRPDARD